MLQILHNIINEIIDVKFSKKTYEKKIWISKREIPSLIIVILWLTRTEATMSHHLYAVKDIMLRLWATNGSNFTFLYFKALTGAVIRFLCGSPLERTPSSGTLVKIDPFTKLPMVLPLQLREKIQKWSLSRDWKEIIALLSFLCLFRSLPTKVRPDLASITNPFDGMCDTLPNSEIRQSLEALGIARIRRFRGKLIFSDKAGPNYRISRRGFVLDAWSLYDSNLREDFSLLLLCSGSYFIFLYWFLCAFLISPLALMYKSYHEITDFANGRLAVVYDQAGKARVIAMANAWIQSAFSGLHDQIFSILKRIPSDATFNQKGVTRAFINSFEGKEVSFFCYDLTSATDRLPLKLQEDILCSLGYPGDLWANIIRKMKWSYRGVDYTYSVGQPMGALSSWGMLALTHHVIVKVAAIRCGLSDFSGYLVLGDDIVITDKSVAEEYLSIMKALGVQINLSKSVISTRFAEFAKLWIGPGFDISPLGSGLLLQSIRDRSSLTTLLAECIEREFFSLRDLLYKNLQNCPRVIKRRITSVLWYMSLSNFRNNFLQSIDDHWNGTIIDIMLKTPKVVDLITVLNQKFNGRFRWTFTELNSLSPKPILLKVLIRIFKKKAYKDINRDWKKLVVEINQFLHSWYSSSAVRREIGYGLLFNIFSFYFDPHTWYVLKVILFKTYTLLGRSIVLYIFDDRRTVNLYRFLFGKLPKKDLSSLCNYLDELELYSYMKLSNHLNEIPKYLEDEEKRKADAKLLNEICLAKDLKGYYSSILKYKDRRAMTMLSLNRVPGDVKGPKIFSFGIRTDMVIVSYKEDPDEKTSSARGPRQPPCKVLAKPLVSTKDSRRCAKLSQSEPRPG